MFVSRGLVGPKSVLNRHRRKETRLIFRDHGLNCACNEACGYARLPCLANESHKGAKNRYGERRLKVNSGLFVGLERIPSAREKLHAVAS